MIDPIYVDTPVTDLELKQIRVFCLLFNEKQDDMMRIIFQRGMWEMIAHCRTIYELPFSQSEENDANEKVNEKADC